MELLESQKPSFTISSVLKGLIRTFVLDQKLTLENFQHWLFVFFRRIFFLSQNKEFFQKLESSNFLSYTKIFVNELPHELPNDLRLRFSQNVGKISNLDGDVAQYQVSLQK